MSRGKKFLIVLAVLGAGVVWAIFYFRAEDVPEKNQKTFETDSSKDSTESHMVDSLLSDPEFDFDFEDGEDSVLIE